MESIALWLTAIGAIIIPIGGYVINGLITKKIDELIAGRKEDRTLFFDRLDACKKYNEDNFVNQKIYDQAMNFHQKETDSKFTSLIESMNKQFLNVEYKIDDVKQLINDKFNKGSTNINNH